VAIVRFSDWSLVIAIKDWHGDELTSPSPSHLHACFPHPHPIPIHAVPIPACAIPIPTPSTSFCDINAGIARKCLRFGGPLAVIARFTNLLTYLKEHQCINIWYYLCRVVWTDASCVLHLAKYFFSYNFIVRITDSVVVVPITVAKPLTINPSPQYYRASGPHSRRITAIPMSTFNSQGINAAISQRWQQSWSSNISTCWVLTSDQHVLCIAQNGIITELELFLVLNGRAALTSQSTNQLRQWHEAVTLVDLINSHIHNTERSCSAHAVATTTAHPYIHQNIIYIDPQAEL